MKSCSPECTGVCESASRAMQKAPAGWCWVGAIGLGRLWVQLKRCWGRGFTLWCNCLKLQSTFFFFFFKNQVGVGYFLMSHRLIHLHKTNCNWDVLKHTDYVFPCHRNALQPLNYLRHNTRWHTLFHLSQFYIYNLTREALLSLWLSKVLCK